MQEIKVGDKVRIIWEEVEKSLTYEDSLRVLKILNETFNGEHIIIAIHEKGKYTKDYHKRYELESGYVLLENEIELI